MATAGFYYGCGGNMGLELTILLAPAYPGVAPAAVRHRRARHALGDGQHARDGARERLVHVHRPGDLAARRRRPPLDVDHAPPRLVGRLGHDHAAIRLCTVRRGHPSHSRKPTFFL
jgi:hypothetical protein